MNAHKKSPINNTEENITIQRVSQLPGEPWPFKEEPVLGLDSPWRHGAAHLTVSSCSSWSSWHFDVAGVAAWQLRQSPVVVGPHRRANTGLIIGSTTISSPLTRSRIQKSWLTQSSLFAKKINCKVELSENFWIMPCWWEPRNNYTNHLLKPQQTKSSDWWLFVWCRMIDWSHLRVLMFEQWIKFSARTFCAANTSSFEPAWHLVWCFVFLHCICNFVLCGQNYEKVVKTMSNWIVCGS